jgi:cytochrome b subunit of formate dehydrogenase
MEFLRRAANPWGQDVLIGVSWDLMWAAVIAAGLFLVGHAVWIKTRPQGTHESTPASVPSGIPEQIQRHSLSARVFHWTMSAAMLTLLVTAFVPLLGFQFPWVTVHWIAGVVLVATVVYHVIHAIGWQDFWSMFELGLAEGVAHIKHVLSPKAPEPPKAGKYPFDHRLYHHAIVVVSLAAIVTGVLMMVRIDTPFWTRNPYLLADSTWGVMYVVHGLSGVSLILLVASHIYFAIRPEKRWITWSMIRGWVDRDHYLAHHDPEKWVVTETASTSGEGGTGALADSAVSAPRDED